MVLFFFLPSISESVGTKCTYRDCHRPLVQSVCTVIVRVLWHKVYLLPLLRSFGTKCTDYHWIQCHFHSPLAESVSTVIVRVFWHKLYLPSLSQFFWQKVYPPALSESFGTKCIYCHCQSFGTKCTHPHCHSPLAQSLSTVIVRLLWHKRGPFFFLILPRFFGAWPFFYSFPRLFGVWPFFFVSLSRLFGAWSCFFIFYAVNIRVLWYKVYRPSLSESCGIKCTHCHCCCSLAQSAPIVIGSNVVVTVLWQKVYPLSLAESFGTKCTYRHCHSSLVESVSIVIV